MDGKQPEDHEHQHEKHGASTAEPSRHTIPPGATSKAMQQMDHQHLQAEPGKWARETERAARPEPHNHHAMIADYRRRFWVSLIITIPILILSPVIQQFL